MNRVRGAAGDKPDLMGIMGDVEGEAEADEDSEEAEDDSEPEVSTLVLFDRLHRPQAATTHAGRLHTSFHRVISFPLCHCLVLLLCAPLSLRRDRYSLPGRKWFEGYDEGNKRFYYHNSETGESIWTKPDAPFVPYTADADSEEEETDEGGEEETFVPYNPDGDSEEEETEDEEEETDEEGEAPEEARPEPAKTPVETTPEPANVKKAATMETVQTDESLPAAPAATAAVAKPEVVAPPQAPATGMTALEKMRQQMAAATQNFNDTKARTDPQNPKRGSADTSASTGVANGNPFDEPAAVNTASTVPAVDDDDKAQSSIEASPAANKPNMRKVTASAPALASTPPPAPPASSQPQRQTAPKSPAPPNRDPRRGKSFVERSQADAEGRALKMKKRREAEHRKLLQAASRSGAMSAKTRAILKKKGILKQDVNQVIERLYNWDATTKKRIEEQTKRYNEIDSATGKPLFSPDISASKAKKMANKSAPNTPGSPARPRTESDAATVSLFQNIFERKLRSASQPPSRASPDKVTKAPSGVAVPLSSSAVKMNQRSVAMFHGRIDADVKLLFELYKNRQDRLDSDSLMRVLQGLDVVTEDQALSSRVAQWLKRLFVLLRYTSAGYGEGAQEDCDDLDEQGIDLESTMRFVKEVILGPSLNSPAVKQTERERLDGQGLTVDALAADEEKELAYRFHEVYTINSLNRKVRLNDERRSVTSARRVGDEPPDKPHLMSKGSKKILDKLESERGQEMHDSHKKEEEKTAMLRKKLEEEEDRHCTFTPELCPGSKKRAAVRNYKDVFTKLHNDKPGEKFIAANVTTEEKEFQDHATFQPENFSREFFKNTQQHEQALLLDEDEAEAAAEAEAEAAAAAAVAAMPSSPGFKPVSAKKVLSAKVAMSQSGHLERMRKAREKQAKVRCCSTHPCARMCSRTRTLTFTLTLRSRYPP
mmetsp:Transcript_45225/g.124298  ORF Transcript_45225/g.124298 Transcript_45225/m.124298 type:complete len:942 (-) Transcript_45225:1512-4337(-)